MHKSYKNEYTAKDLQKVRLVRTSGKERPQCPVCKTKTYVRPYLIGLRGVEPIIFEEGKAPKPETIHAPYTCIDEGYSWDCPRCLIIF